MKKTLTILLVLSIATLALMGCSLIFGATYSVDSGDGFCYEIETSEFSVILLFEAIDGVVKEPCDTTNAVASCTFDSDVYNQEMVNYYSAEYLALTPELKADCAADGGTWKTF